MILFDQDGNVNSFQTFLTESNSVRMEHAEDIVFSDGYQGAIDSINFLNGVKESLESNVSNNINVTVKWDGSPGLYCGINPENGQFFVATQKIMNKNPVVNHTEQEIEQNHQGGPVQLMKAALHYLPELGIETILQGDVMFGPGDVVERTIDGERYLTFKPNTILYAVPVRSKLGQRIKQANFGIIFHTELRGETLKDLRKSFNVNVSKLNQTKDVWFDDATYRDQSGTVTLTTQQSDQIDQYLDDAREVLKTIGQQRIDQFVKQNPKLIALIKQHLNSKVRQGEHIGNPRQHVEHLLSWLDEKFEQEAVKKKTEKGAEGQRSQAKAKKQLITNNKQFLIKFFSLVNAINEAKIILVRHLEQVKNIDHFLETEDGLKVTAPEGFVAVDHLSDSAIKLVDRLEFSKANFAAAAKKGY